MQNESKTIFHKVQDIQNAIIKECGKRNFKAIENITSSHVTTEEVKNAWRNRSSFAKKITLKRFIELKDEYLEAKNEFAIFCAKSKIAKLDLIYKWNAKNAPSRNFVQTITRKTSQAKLPIITALHVRINNDTNLNIRTKELKIHRDNLIKQDIESVLPCYSHGDVSICFSENEDISKCDFYANKTQGEWLGRRGGWSIWANDVDCNVILQKNYYHKLIKTNLSVIDGMFTLSISDPLIIKSNILDLEVRSATWAVKKQGCNYGIKKGFIAFAFGISFHGKTVKSVINGIVKKCATVGDVNISLATKSVKKAINIKKCPVYLNDSYAVGNCESGTKSFCYMHDIDISGENPEIELSALAKIALKHPSKEVIAVVLQKLRSI